jgi:glutathione S-transferase
MGYTLITANRNYSSWSLRPWILMRALGLPFEDRIEPFLESVNYARFRAFSPTGTVPVLIDGARTVWDSLGIVLYLADRHEGVWPQGDDARAWAQGAVAEMHAGFPALRGDCPMNVGVRVEVEAFSAALLRDVARIDALWSEGLARFGGPFLGGEAFSAVDAFFAPVAWRARTHGLTLGDKAAAWATLMRDLPEMREWEAAALAETWREPSHEQEVGATGKIVADYRAV